MGKKILCVMLLIFALLLAFVACDSGSNGDDTLDDSTPSAHTHTFGEWETVKAATCTADGSKERYCDCGEKQTATIAQIAHNFSEWGVVKEATATEKGSEERSCACGKKETREIPVKEIVNTEEVQFNNACSLIAEGKFEQAYELLNGIKNYAPAKKKLANFFYAPMCVMNGKRVILSGVGPQMKYENTVYTYDKGGNITLIEKGNDTFELFYDASGNVLSGYENLADPRSSDACNYSYQNGKLHKITYNDKSFAYHEYFYDNAGNITRLDRVYKDGTCSSIEYTYTYYSDNTVKTMRYVNNFSMSKLGMEFHYNADGQLTRVNIFDKTFSDCYGYLTFTYGEYGMTGAKYYGIEAGEETLYTEFEYTYDATGKQIEFKVLNDGEMKYIYTYQDYKLCYNENADASEKLGAVYQTDFDQIFWYVS